MAKFPEPPAALTLSASVRALPAGTHLWRVFFAGGEHAVPWNAFRFFGPANARFDHHDEPPRVQAKGIFYAASAPVTCLAEVFQATRLIDRGARQPWLVAFDTVKRLGLLDLTGAWPTKAGASMALSTGPRPRARRWSRLFHATYPTLDGIHYPSAMHANAPCVALYERAERALPRVPVFLRALSDPALARRLGAAAETLGYKIV
ncbi:MAG: RES family NAD+ phosphorylase [Polyangiaceae bacterium]|nr:RES family NAD+ phosphorylase [Polyangiaceae bacterium]